MFKDIPTPLRVTRLENKLPTKLDTPSGGSNGQVLTKTANGPAWQNAPSELPSGGTAGQVLKKTASGSEWADEFGSIAVTGTTPTINALSGVRYVCGEVATLDITLPASGIVDVVFESGSTPTVLTVTPPSGVTIKWANGFDPTSLEANMAYEIRVTDGEFGVAVVYGSNNSNTDNGWTYIRDISLDPNNQTPNVVYGVDANNHIGYVTINEDADGNSFSYKYVMVVGRVSISQASGILYAHPTPMNNLSLCQISAWNIIDKADTMFSVCMWNEKFFGNKIISHCIAGRQYADQKFRFGGAIMGDLPAMAGSPMSAFLNETTFNSITIGEINFRIIDGTVSVFGRN